MIASTELRIGRPVGAVSTVASQQLFLATSALLFAASATLTISLCRSMSSMGAMPMPGRWSMSIVWMRMPGQTWLGASASFLGMWSAMMIAMMLPSLVPMLWRYRRGISYCGETHAGYLTALAGAGYFFVWALIGMAVFPLGVALASVEMQQAPLSRAVPSAAGVVVLIAGVLQFTPWKLGHLACCRGEQAFCHTLRADHGNAWRFGVHLAVQCGGCCATWTAILLVAGIMDLRAMIVVTIAITAERLAPDG